MKRTLCLILAAATISGCASVDTQRHAPDDGERPAVPDVACISENDRDILKMVITDWHADPDSEGEIWPTKTNDTLIVFTPSVTFTYRVQIEMDIRPRVVPEDVMASFTNRNSQTFDICSVGALDPTVVITKRNERYWVNFGETYPKAKGFIAISVPGYSKGKNQALVRLRGGPAYHGVTSTYFLEKNGDAWVIKWKETAHYM